MIHWTLWQPLIHFHFTTTLAFPLHHQPHRKMFTYSVPPPHVNCFLCATILVVAALTFMLPRQSTCTLYTINFLMITNCLHPLIVHMLPTCKVHCSFLNIWIPNYLVGSRLVVQFRLWYYWMWAWNQLSKTSTQTLKCSHSFIFRILLFHTNTHWYFLPLDPCHSGHPHEDPNSLEILWVFSNHSSYSIYSLIKYSHGLHFQMSRALHHSP